jgi:hypothetical protein
MALSLSMLMATPNLKAQSLVARPPQFVLFAFDGSLSLPFWMESRDFAKKINAEGKTFRFTYFLSGVYFLGLANKMEYNAPKHGPGKSAIGFGGELSSLPLRVEQVNKALEEGHEMGSHANGHYDGGSERWTEEDWRSEFSQFNHLIFDLFSINKVKPVRPQGWLLQQKDIIGFRAPQLGLNSAMYTSLAAAGFRYDTSRSAAPNYWPQKSALGIWNFPLAEIPIVGTGKKTLSMDYNFYVAQSGANEQPQNRAIYYRQMMDTYLKYFQDNYNGNRAPVHIGHHFSKWNGSAYWDAMKDFASQVCGLPEVQCVTYTEYMNWLERQTASDLAAYKKGQFEKLIPVRLAQNTEVKQLNVGLASVRDEKLMVRAVTPVREELRNLVARISVNGQVVGRSEVDLQTIRSQHEGESVSITAQLFNRLGVEVARATQVLKDVGLSTERLDPEVLEARALKGDLPEAHMGELDVIPEEIH